MGATSFLRQFSFLRILLFLHRFNVQLPRGKRTFFCVTTVYINVCVCACTIYNSSLWYFITFVYLHIYGDIVNILSLCLHIVCMYGSSTQCVYLNIYSIRWYTRNHFILLLLFFFFALFFLLICSFITYAVKRDRRVCVYKHFPFLCRVFGPFSLQYPDIYTQQV